MTNGEPEDLNYKKIVQYGLSVLGGDDCPIFGQISDFQIETFCLVLSPSSPSHNTTSIQSSWNLT